MKISHVTNLEKEVYAFEIEYSICLTPKKILKIIKEIDGVTEIRHKPNELLYSDEIIRFKFNEIEFLIFEPFGDSGILWIGPDEGNKPSNEINLLISVFSKIKVFYCDKIFYFFIATLIFINIINLVFIYCF